MHASFSSWKRQQRWALALVMLLGVAPAVVLWLCSFVYFQRLFEDQARNRMGSLLEAQARQLTTALEKRAGRLREIAESPEVRSALENWDGRALGNRAETLRASLSRATALKPDLLPLFVGRALEPPVEVGTDLQGTDFEWTTQDLPTGRLSRDTLRLRADLSDPHATRFALAVPVADPPGCWLGTSVGGAELEALVARTFGSGSVYLTRSDGLPLAARSSDAWAQRFEYIAGDRRRQGGGWRSVDERGAEHYYQARWLPAGVDLVLVAQLPGEAVFRGLRGFHLVALLVALLGIGLSAAGIFIVLLKVNRPLEELEKSLGAVSAGTLPSSAPEAGPEGQLARELLEAVRPAQEAARRWQRRAETLESIAGRLSSTALIGCARDGLIRTLSAGASRLTGWTEGSLVGQPLKVLFETPDWERMAARLFGGGSEVAEIRERLHVRRRSNEPVETDLRVVPLEEPGQEGFLLVLHEISAKSDREMLLAAGEERLRAVIDGLPDGVGILNGERVDYANPALLRLLRRPAEEIIGNSFADHIGARELLPVLDALRRAARGAPPGDPFDAELRTSNPDQVLAVRLTIRSGTRPGQVVIAVRDVSRLREAEAALSRERHRLDLTLESTSDGILAVYYHAGGSAVMLTNTRLLDLFSLDPSEIDRLPGGDAWQRLGDNVGADDRWRARRELFERPSEESFTERFELVPGGDPCTLEIFCGPIRAGNGHIVGRVATFRDITDQRRAESALRDRSAELASSQGEVERAYRELEIINRDLERRTQELTRLNRELRSLDEMKSGLLANVSHELQTPLVSIKGYTEMILKEKLGPLNDQQRRGLDVALKNINRLIGLIDNLLSFSRMEGETAELRVEAFPLRALIEEVAETLRTRAQERKVEIILPPSGDDFPVKADRDKISQVVMNLLSNAIKFNRPDGKIWIDVGAGRRGYLKVEVRDTGVGIPAEALDKIFDRFYQVDATASRRQDGTGIGLSIVKNILRMHGCMIRADSNPGEGSVFSFTLPAARRARHERSTPRSDSEEPDSGGHTRERSRPSRPLGEEPKP